jgi:hypothetical protein
MPPKHKSDKHSAADDPAVAKIKETSMFKPIVHKITAEHESALKELKESFDAPVPDWVDDGIFMRFLRQKKFDVDGAFDALSNHIAWVESFVEWPRDRVEAHPEFKAAIAYLLPEADYFGRPIMYVRPRNINPALRADAEGVRQVFCSLVRDVNAFCKKHGTDSAVILYDLHGFAARNRDNATMKMQIDVMEKQYPGGLGNIVFCRYPWLLYPVYSVAKLWLDKETTERVVFCDDLSTLLQLTHKKNIPEGLGGELKEREPSIEVWPKTKGWFSGWFGGGADSSTASTAAPAAQEDDDGGDPFAGLSEAERKKKLEEMERDELKKAKELEEQEAKETEKHAHLHAKTKRTRRQKGHHHHRK